MNQNRIEIISETYHESGYVVIDEIVRSHFEDMVVVPLEGCGTGKVLEMMESLRSSLNVHKGHRIRMQSAYTVGGDYIGNEKTAEMLCDDYGIYPEKASPEDDVCSIGFSRKDRKWYGWSHRAIYGFTVGDVVKEGDCCASSGWTEEYLQEHPEDNKALPVGFEAKTFEDAKRMAVAFAESVG